MTNPLPLNCFLHIPTERALDYEPYGIEIAQYHRILRDITLASLYVTAKKRADFADSFFVPLMDKLKAFAVIPPQTEIGIEVSASLLNRETIKTLASFGFNRISLANGEKMEHSNLQALVNVALAEFETVNVDCIIKSDTIDHITDTLHIFADFKAPHLSVYGLPNHADFCEARNLLAEYGYHPYDPFHFAVGDHNRCHYLTGVLHYDDYIGLGPGAHGSFTVNGRKHHCVTDTDFNKWVTDSKSKLILTPLSDEDILEEYLLQNLTLIDGISFKRFKRFFDSDFDTVFNLPAVLGYCFENKPVLIESSTGIKVTDNTHEGVARATYALLDSMH